MKKKLYLALTTGEMGMRKQATAIARSLAMEDSCESDFQEIIAPLHAPWRYLRGSFPYSQQFMFHTLPIITAPCVMVTCGRRSVLTALWIKKHTVFPLFHIHVQDPLVSLKHFDLIISPHHDRLSEKYPLYKERIIETLGAPHNITQDQLQQSYHHWAPMFQHCHDTKFAVIIGGKSKYHRLSLRHAKKLVCFFTRLSQHFGASLLITLSRRTPPNIRNFFLSSFAGSSQHYIWDENHENPYLGILAHGGKIFVTCDSISMLSEATITGKPLYIIPMEIPMKGSKKNKLRSFYDQLVNQNHAQWMDLHCSDLPPVFVPTILNERVRILPSIQKSVKKFFFP